jgi:hypothetical protein
MPAGIEGIRAPDPGRIAACLYNAASNSRGIANPAFRFRQRLFTCSSQTGQSVTASWRKLCFRLEDGATFDEKLHSTEPIMSSLGRPTCKLRKCSRLRSHSCSPIRTLAFPSRPEKTSAVWKDQSGAHRQGTHEARAHPSSGARPGSRAGAAMASRITGWFGAPPPSCFAEGSVYSRTGLHPASSVNSAFLAILMLYSNVRPVSLP